MRRFLIFVIGFIVGVVLAKAFMLSSEAELRFEELVHVPWTV